MFYSVSFLCRLETLKLNFLRDFEAEFFKDLKDKFNSGNLTHEQFKALMEQHLTRLGNASLQAPQEPKNKPTYKVCSYL